MYMMYRLRWFPAERRRFDRAPLSGCTVYQAVLYRRILQLKSARAVFHKRIYKAGTMQQYYSHSIRFQLC